MIKSMIARARPLLGWWREDRCSLIAAGVAFYALLAMVPAISAFAGVYALVTGEVPDQPFDETLVRVLPEQTRAVVVDQLESMRAASSATVTAGVVLALVITVWSASAAVKHLLDAVAPHGDRRTYVRARLVGFGLTLALIVFFVFALAATAALPRLLSELDVGRGFETAFQLLQWPVLAAGMLLVTAVIFRAAAAGTSRRRRFFSFGVWVATGLWLTGSVGFSTLAASAPRVHSSYGSFAAVAVTMLWFWLFGAALQVGALSDRAREATSSGPEAEPSAGQQ